MVFNTLGTRDLFSRATRSFRRVSAAGRHVFGRRPKKREKSRGSLIRLDRNRKPRMKKVSGTQGRFSLITLSILKLQNYLFSVFIS